MRVVLFGYHDVGCACLQALLDMRAEISLIVTHSDDPGENIWFGSVERLAEARGIAVSTPADVNAREFIETLRGLEPDVFLSAYFRQILSREVLAIPRVGAYNMHGSLLPKFRGRAPVNWVLVKGEAVTGVTLHHMTEKPDRGDIVGQRAIPIEDSDTALTLHRKCAAAAGDLMRELWPLIEAGTAPRVAQDPARASYYGRRRPEDGRIDWTQPARACWNLVRAVTHPYPGAFTYANGRKLFVWEASVLEGEPRIEPGARRKSAKSGAPAPPGSSVRGPGAPVSAGANRPDAMPGQVSAVVSGRGFVVSTGEGSLLVERAQIEGIEELAGDQLVARGLASIGQRLD